MVEIFIPRAIYDASRRFIPPAASDKSIFLLCAACSNAPSFGKLKFFRIAKRIQFSPGIFFLAPRAAKFSTREAGVINLTGALAHLQTSLAPRGPPLCTIVLAVHNSAAVELRLTFARYE